MEARGLTLRPVKVAGASTTSQPIFNDQLVVNFGSGDYLGLAMNQTAIEAQVEAVRDYGLTASGPRFTCGTLNPHLELEREIASHQGEEEAILFFLVTVASSSIISAILDSPWTDFMPEIGVQPIKGTKQIFADQFSHKSLSDACKLAVGKGRREVLRYHHCDMQELERMLGESTADTKLIVTDGVFSADGDLAPLPQIAALAEKYEAMLLVDDAHGTGILGRTGRGIWEHFDLADQVDFKIGSLAKAVAGGMGGFIACDRTMADYLRQNSGHYIFGGSAPPGVVAAITENVRQMQREGWRRETVLSNAEYLRTKLRRYGYTVLGDNTPIVPIVVGNSDNALGLSRELLELGFYAPPFRYPATEKDRARLRLTISANHTKVQMDQFISALNSITEPVQALQA